MSTPSHPFASIYPKWLYVVLLITGYSVVNNLNISITAHFEM